MPVPELLPVRFSAAIAARDLVEVHAAEPFGVTWSGGRLANWLGTSELSEEERTLFTGLTSHAVVLVDQQASDLNVGLARGESLFRADIACRVDVARGSIGQQIDIDVRPESGAIRSLLIHATQQLDGFRWFLDEESGRLPLVPKAQNTSKELTAVDLDFPEPCDQPFRVVGQRTVTASSQLQVPLVRIPDAASQSGRVVVSAAPDTALEVNASSTMRSLLPDAEDARTQRGFYQHFGYEPQNEALDPTLSLSITERAQATQRLASVRLMEMVSFVDHGGRVLHEAKMFVENLGDSTWPCRYPKI
jgi:hypothetical protein